MLTVGILGTGSMGSAIARGVAANGKEKFRLCLYARRKESSAPLAEELGAEVATDPDDLVTKSDITVIAVKPYQVNGVLSKRLPWQVNVRPRSQRRHLPRNP